LDAAEVLGGNRQRYGAPGESGEALGAHIQDQMAMILDKIKHENDIRDLSKEEIEQLPEEIRSFLIEKISRRGPGIWRPTVGVVELTIALHLVSDTAARTRSSGTWGTSRTRTSC